MDYNAESFDLNKVMEVLWPCGGSFNAEEDRGGLSDRRGWVYSVLYDDELYLLQIYIYIEREKMPAVFSVYSHFYPSLYYTKERKQKKKYLATSWASLEVDLSVDGILSPLFL